MLAPLANYFIGANYGRRHVPTAITQIALRQGYLAADAARIASLVFPLGLAGANFTMYTPWLLELYATGCRAGAMGFISSIGRFVGMGMIFLVAAGVNYFGSIGTPNRPDIDRDLPGIVSPALRCGDAGPAAADLIVNETADSRQPAVYHRLIRLGLGLE